jgi:hypothetical protein
VNKNWSGIREEIEYKEIINFTNKMYVISLEKVFRQS